MEERNSIRDFAIWWNNNFPIDLWYRKKHKLRFNSEEHRQTSFYDILLEWEEENAFREYENNKWMHKEEEEFKETGVWLRTRNNGMSEDEINTFFGDNVDWDALND